MRLLCLSSVAALLAACASAPPPPPERIGTAAGPPLLAVTATATASAVTAAPPPSPPSPYFPVIVHAAPAFRVFALKAGAVVVNGYATTLIHVDDRGARLEPSLSTGLEGPKGQVPPYLVTTVSGDWPRSGSLELNIPGDRGGTDVAYAWKGSSWVKTAAQPLGDMPADVSAAYYQGGFLGSISWQGRSFYYLVHYDEAGDVTLPRFARSRSSKGAPPTIARGTGPCPTRIAGYAFVRQDPGGDLIGLGKLCTRKDDNGPMAWEGPGALAVERWRKGAASSVIEPLPGSEGKGVLRAGGGGLSAGASGEVYVWANLEGTAPEPYVAHHDGKAWTNVSPSSDQTITDAWVDAAGSLWLTMDRELLRRRAGAWEKLSPEGAKPSISWLTRAPDGTPWARFGDDLWHFTAAGAWEKAVLPRDAGGHPLVAESVAWLSSGNMLIVARGDADVTLLAGIRPEKVFDAEAEEPAMAVAKVKDKAAAFGRVGPPTPGCKSLFAVLYKLSRVAPPDFDFPLTREALKGHTELSDVRFAETEDGGSRYLVAFVPSLARGQKLLATVRDKVQGARPQLLCGEPPKVNRTLSIDLRTGELKK